MCVSYNYLDTCVLQAVVQDRLGYHKSDLCDFHIIQIIRKLITWEISSWAYEIYHPCSFCKLLEDRTEFSTDVIFLAQLQLHLKKHSLEENSRQITKIPCLPLQNSVGLYQTHDKAGWFQIKSISKSVSDKHTSHTSFLSVKTLTAGASGNCATWPRNTE